MSDAYCIVTSDAMSEWDRPTEILGFKNGVLHQKYAITVFRNGYPDSARTEWRKVEEIAE